MIPRCLAWPGDFPGRGVGPLLVREVQALMKVTGNASRRPCIEDAYKSCMLCACLVKTPLAVEVVKLAARLLRSGQSCSGWRPEP